MDGAGVRLGAVVLAGGRSRRMGTDKALVRWRGRSLLEQVCVAAAIAADSVAVLTPWPERYGADVAGPVVWLPEPVGIDGVPPGPLAALALALESWEAAELEPVDWVLLLGCDLPLLSGARLREWRSRLDRLDASILAWVPRTGDRWEPLCGFYRPLLLPSLRAALAAGARSFQPWLSALPAEPLPLTAGDRAMLHNCNRPEDLPDGASCPEAP
ncbi:MAG: molybdenum cofactor guanylyltransferase [Cyanophyceae cyanobacterium]